MTVASRRAWSARLAAFALALAGVTVPSACGGEPPRGAVGSGEAGVGRADGRAVFLSQCQGCHALENLGAPRPVGGDLTNYDMSAAEVLSFARIMPTPRQLTSSELRAVSEFVSSVQRRNPRGPAATKRRPGAAPSR